MSSIAYLRFLVVILLIFLLVGSHSGFRYRHRRCKKYHLLQHEEWIPTYYWQPRAYRCTDGFRFQVAILCRRGRWWHKLICVPQSTTTPRTTHTTKRETITTVLTTTTTDQLTLSQSTNTQIETTPITVQCIGFPVIDNGTVIENNTSVDSDPIIPFRCNSGFTANGRYGNITCGENGVFEADLVCEDCRLEDRIGEIGNFMTVPADNQTQCNDICDMEQGCFMGRFFGECELTFLIGPGNSSSLEACRSSCFTSTEPCMAFTFRSGGFNQCRLFTRRFDVFLESDNFISSSCV